MPPDFPDPYSGRRIVLVALFGLFALGVSAAPMFGLAQAEPIAGQLFENVALMALAFLAGRSSG